MKVRKMGSFVLDLLFPQRCAFCGKVQGFTDNCDCRPQQEALRLPAEPLPPLPLPGPLFLAQHWACYAYGEPVRGAILRMKFEDEPHLAKPLGERLYAQYLAAGLEGRFDALVPAPIGKKRLRQRGYNQSLLLARQLASHVNLPVLGTALKKTRETQPQAELGREERLGNLQDAFVADAAQVQGKRLLLVDDVITTGSTVNECARALCAAGAAQCCALSVAGSAPEKQVYGEEESGDLA